MHRRLLQLFENNRHAPIADPAKAQRGFWLANAAAADPDRDGDSDAPGAPDEDETGVVNLYVYDVIGPCDWQINSATIAPRLAALEAKTINLHLNSPGGDVFEARAIKTALEQHSARVVVHVDGLAASAASFLMLAADEIRIARGAFVMIHNPWGFAMGDAKEMRRSADLLDQVGAAIAGDYSAKTGLAADELLAMMDAETWMDSATAVAKGFCDVEMEKKTKASALNRFDVSAFANAPDLNAAAKSALDAEAAFEEGRAFHARMAKLIALGPAA
ncbi:head maturation protease, ClpP-related [Methylocystis parvus]|uniref:head maturation protease, ClpP-related n=1 Tax=Methylocystis parvus TaxID=134 RepID=UPI003C721D92